MYFKSKKRSKYEEQHIAVDIVILTTEDEEIQKLRVLLIKRKIDPFKDCWAIPGGHLDEGESLEQAAYRELMEETSLTPEELGGVTLRQFKAYGDPGRDPRYRMVSIVFCAIVQHNEKLMSAVHAQDDAKEAAWFPLQHLPKNLAFDHKKILNDISSAPEYLFLPEDLS
jgi:8-oxo-dGTP diphosphatase